MDLLQNKVEHLERERIELTMQLHKRDEKDRDRKLRLEHLELRLKISEEERSKATNELHEAKDKLSNIYFENQNLQQEVNRLAKELQSSNRFEAMDVWKKMTTATRELKRVEEELIVVSEEKTSLSREVALLKSELMQHRESHNRLKETFSLSSDENANLLKELAQLQSELTVASEEKTSLSGEVDLLKSELTQHRESHGSLKETLSLLSDENANLLKELAQLQSNIVEYQQSQIVFEDKIAVSNEDSTALSKKLALLQSELNHSKTEIVAVPTEEYDQIINDLKRQLAESEKTRRKLHNQVQDLRGNIRVFIRCRPFLPSDGEESFQSKQCSILFNEDGNSVSLINCQNAVSTNNGNARVQAMHQFAFDKTFGQDAEQHEIYEEVSGLVQSVLDGYRTCVFSYGQTGSGKTHTMTGERLGNQRGIIPRSIEELLQQSQKLQDSGWEIQLCVSIVELYNEELRDLLHSSNNRTGANTSTNGEKFKIIRQNNGRVIVTGLSSMPITTTDYDEGLHQFYELLERASQIRSTASTNMNETSSRSHLIVMIDVIASYVSQNGFGQKVILNGGLRLCDLAGSERLDRTNTLNDSARLKETVNINKSLSCLADVFLALGNKQSHVPYRNSKLTMLLQDCLSGDGKSLMFVNVSPTVASSPETLCSLRFANQVSQVELGKAQKHIMTTSVIPLPQQVNNVPASPVSKSSKPPVLIRNTPVVVINNSSKKRPFTAVEEDSVCSSSLKTGDENLDDNNIITSSSSSSGVALTTKPFKSFLTGDISPKPFRGCGMTNNPAPVYSFLNNNQSAAVANNSCFVSSTTATKSRLGNPVRKQQPIAGTGSQQPINTSFVRKKTKYFR